MTEEQTPYTGITSPDVSRAMMAAEQRAKAEAAFAANDDATAMARELYVRAAGAGPMKTDEEMGHLVGWAVQAARLYFGNGDNEAKLSTNAQAIGMSRRLYVTAITTGTTKTVDEMGHIGAWAARAAAVYFQHGGK